MGSDKYAVDILGDYDAFSAMFDKVLKEKKQIDSWYLQKKIIGALSNLEYFSSDTTVRNYCHESVWDVSSVDVP